MKIAIIGSRGIPNNYGGFEQFAEYLSKSLVARNHEVWVCNPHYHHYRGNVFFGVNIKHIYNPETILGTSGNFIYDYLCLRFAIKVRPDIILMLGYTTSSVWFRIFNFGDSILVTNLDGLEWKRDKWGMVVKRLTRWFETLAVKYGGHLIADHPAIQQYFLEQHHKQTSYIPYGAEVFNNPDESEIKTFELDKKSYSLLIARFEAEHNIEMIIEGFLAGGRQELLLLVGNHLTAYGQKLKSKFSENKQVRFMGGIYDMKKLNNLRYFSNFYFHGHSIGGTNPSLLEAMASGALIIAHNNPFNKGILENNAVYFSTAAEISEILKTMVPDSEASKVMLQNNINKIKDHYNWHGISLQYENLFKEFLLQEVTSGVRKNELNKSLKTASR